MAGARSLPEAVGFRAWQAAVAKPGGRVGKRAIMQPGKGKILPGDDDVLDSYRVWV